MTCLMFNISVNGNDWVQVDNVNDTQVDVRVQVNGGDNVRWRANAGKNINKFKLY